MITEGDFKYFFDNEEKTREEIEKLADYATSITVGNGVVHYFSPKKSLIKEAELSLDNLKYFMINQDSTEKDLTDVIHLITAENKEDLSQRFAEIKLKKSAQKRKTEEILEEVNRYQEQNGGRIEGVEFPFDAVLTPTKSNFITVEEKDILSFLGYSENTLEEKQKSEGKGINIMPNGLARGRIFTNPLPEIGKKESQTVKKAPIFTYCKQMKNAIEALSLRSLYGHEKYEKGDDWENFSRVENGDFEYSNAQFRHALGIGEDNERDHHIAEAWNAVAKLELYLRKDLHSSK